MISRNRIIEMKGKGLTQSEIGRNLGITAERVRQIIRGKSNKKERQSRDDILLSTAGVARLLNVHTNTVRRWSSSGILKAIRLGVRGDRRFKRREVLRLMKRNINLDIDS